MKAKFDETGVKRKVLDILENQGWQVYQGDGDYKWGSRILDEKFDRDLNEVCYWNLLKSKIININKISSEDADRTIDKLKREINAENLVKGNRDFYKFLREGIKVRISSDEKESKEVVKLLDRENINNNSFIAVDEYQFQRKSRQGIRPDITLFLNGIPIINIECKATAQDTFVEDGIADIRDYEEKEPRLFVPALFNGVVDGEKFRYGAIKASEKYYFPWRSEDYTAGDLEMTDSLQDLFHPEKIMDILEYFVFYEENQTKIIPRYMQYRAANRLVERIKKGERKKGLIWHTQGSGKSYTMLFTAYKAKKSARVEDAQYIVVVDRDKLNKQMADTLSSINFPAYQVAQSINHLEKLLSQNKSQLILTTIQKFQDMKEGINAEVDMDTVVLVDEAHRFMEAKFGSELKKAIPEEKRFYFGFTGTPVHEGNSERDRSTFREFSQPEDQGYLHRYSIKRGQQDNIIIPVTFNIRKIEWDISDEELDREFESEFDEMEPEQRQEIIKKYVNETELTELRPRMEKVIQDIHEHYTNHVEPNNFKAMVVTPSRKAAALYGDELQKHFDSRDIEVIISPDGDHNELIDKYHLSDSEETTLIDNFKKESHPKILVVCDKLLTGFDAPVLKTIYLDKTLWNHNLLQAIARTNRPCQGKENGEIVDYQGIFQDLEEILQYDDIVLDYAVHDTEEFVERFKDLVSDLMSIFDEIDLVNDPEVFYECVSRLEKHTEIGTKYERLYKKAQSLYETLQPHEELAKQPLKTHWEILTQIYARYKSLGEDGEENLGDNVREKTRRILEENMDVSQIKRDGQVEYEIPDREVLTEGDVEQPRNKYGFIERVMAQIKTYEPKTEQNIIYEKLRKRVREIIDKWRNDEINEAEGMEELEEVKEKEQESKRKQEEKEFTDVEFAVFKNIMENFDYKVSGSQEAEEIARAIGDRIEQISATGYLPEIRKEIRKAIIYSIVRDLGKKDFFGDDKEEFLNQTISYVLANKG